MWYKKSYLDDAEGLEQALAMCDAFRALYNREARTHPGEARELAMFGLFEQFFHSNSRIHGPDFFLKHKCEPATLPQDRLPEFVYGDREFAEIIRRRKKKE